MRKSTPWLICGVVVLATAGVALLDNETDERAESKNAPQLLKNRSTVLAQDSDASKGGEKEGNEYKSLLTLLPKSKHTLAEGIGKAAKSSGAPISAKFEPDDNDKTKLSLSVYTAEKGLNVDAEHNVLKEVSGDPATDKWEPKVEVIKDMGDVVAGVQQFTLMAISKFSLLDIVAKAEKEQKGTVFSITPMVEHQKPMFMVLVAKKGTVIELKYDLLTGETMKVGNEMDSKQHQSTAMVNEYNADIVTAVRAAASKDCGCGQCAAKGCEPCHGKNCYYCVAKALDTTECGCGDCNADGCKSCGPGCDVCKFHLAPVEKAKEKK